MSRRSRLAFLDVKSTEAALPRIAEIMAAALGWSDKQRTASLTSAAKYLQVRAGACIPHMAGCEWGLEAQCMSGGGWGWCG